MALHALPIKGGTSAVPGREPGRKFGELLIEELLVTREQLDEALRIQSTLRTYVPIGQILTMHGWLKRADLTAALTAENVGLTDTVVVKVAFDIGLPVEMVLPDLNGLGVRLMRNLVSLIAR